MSFKVTRKKQFAIKLETTAGTKETIAVGDYGLLLTEMAFDMGVEMFDNNTFKGSIDQSAGRVGKASASCTVGGEFKNSGTLNTAPKIDPVLQASRMVRSVVKGVAFTGATGASTRGADIIRGGTSNATGRLVKLEGTKIYLADISGTFTNGETLTDSLGTWTATAGATDATATGYVYRAVSTGASELTATVYGNEDGIAQQLYGSASNFSLDLNTDGYAKFTGTFSGILDKDIWGDAVAQESDDAITWETSAPEIVTNASLSIGTYTPVGVSRVTADLGNAPTLIKDLNSATWLRHAVVNSRSVNGSIDMLSIDPATYNAYQAFIAGSLASLNFSIGSGAGKQIEVIMPYIQYTGLKHGDKDGFLMNAITYKAVGDDESILIWFR